MTNTPLVPVFTGTISNQSIQLCNARDLYQFLEVGKDFSTWIKNRIEQYGFIEGEDYSPILGNRSDGKSGKRRTEYHLTLDMAKELAMVENNDKGRRIRRYFISLERKALPDHSAHLAEVERAFKRQYQQLRKKYNYPRELLGQPDFTTSDGMVRLDINMLADRKFISPLFGLLNELRADGHDVTAAWAEAEAMRQGLIKADEAFDQIWNIALKTKVSPAKINEKGRR